MYAAVVCTHKHVMSICYRQISCFSFRRWFVFYACFCIFLAWMFVCVTLIYLLVWSSHTYSVSFPKQWVMLFTFSICFLCFLFVVVHLSVSVWCIAWNNLSLEFGMIYYVSGSKLSSALLPLSNVSRIFK